MRHIVYATFDLPGAEPLGALTLKVYSSVMEVFPAAQVLRVDHDVCLPEFEIGLAEGMRLLNGGAK